MVPINMAGIKKSFHVLSNVKVFAMQASWPDDGSTKLIYKLLHRALCYMDQTFAM